MIDRQEVSELFKQHDGGFVRKRTFLKELSTMVTFYYLRLASCRANFKTVALQQCFLLNTKAAKACSTSHSF